MTTLMKRIAGGYRAACIRTVGFVEMNANAFLFLIGAGLVTGGLIECSHAVANVQTFSEANFDDTLIRNSVGNLFKLIEGAFGALIMVVAGLGAIVAAAMGAYRAAVGMLVVAVGAFILRALVSLFFGTDYDDYVAGGA